MTTLNTTDLNILVTARTNLANNLVAKGVAAVATESYPSLVDKVADIITAVPTPHEVRYIDTDAKIIFKKAYATGGSVNTYPPSPTRADKPWLHFVRWTHTLDQLKNFQYRTSEDNLKIPGHVDVGAIYETSDNCTHIIADIRSSYSMSLTVYFSKIGTSTSITNIDWDDGGIVDRFAIATTTKTHMYATEGIKHIKIWTDNNLVYGLGGGTTASSVVTTGKDSVIGIYFANNVVLKNYTCYQFRGLKEATLPGKAVNTNIPVYCFLDCNNLKCAIVPDGYAEALPDSFVYNCFCLEYIVIPMDIVNLSNNSLRFTNMCERIVIPKGITKLPKYVLQNGGAVELISDPITIIEDNALTANYPGVLLNIANEITMGNDALTNNFSYMVKKNLIINVNTAVTVTGLCTWAQGIEGRITIRGMDNLTIPAISGIYKCKELVFGANVIAIKGIVSMVNIMVYIFEGEIPPTLSTNNILNGSAPTSLNKLAKIYVPDESLALYKSTQYYTSIANQIYPISEYVPL